MLALLRVMTGRRRQRAFDLLPADFQEAITEPCSGEAHANPHIDNCMICLYTTWGRMLRRLPETP